MDTSYKSLHDPHLKSYYHRKDILKKLKKDGYITSNNRVICNLKEFNEHRHYLTGLKLDFERNYIREQKIIEKQVNNCYKLKNFHNTLQNHLFREWLLEEKSQVNVNQEALLRHRYMDMINTELHKTDEKEEKPGTSYMKEEENSFQKNIIKQLYLHKQIEEGWKRKEALLLSKIGEEVRREERLEKQRQKNKEADWKKQLSLEKKMAYHLQKVQKTPFKKEESMHGTTIKKKPLIKVEVTLPVVKKMSITETESRHSRSTESRTSVHLFNRCTKKSEKGSMSFVLPVSYGEKSKIIPCSGDDGNTYLPCMDIRNIYEHKSQDTTKHQVSSDLSGKRSKRLSFNLDSAHTHTFQHPLFKHLFDQNLSQENLQITNRDSFQDISGHNIYKAEFLRDDWRRERDSFRQWKVNSSSDEEEIVLKEVLKELPKGQSEDQLNENSWETTVATAPMTRNSGKTHWFLRRSGYPTSANVAEYSKISVPWRESQEEQIVRVVSATDLDTTSTDLDVSVSKRSQQNGY